MRDEMTHDASVQGSQPCDVRLLRICVKPEISTGHLEINAYG